MVSTSFARSWARAIRQPHERAAFHRHAAAQAGNRSGSQPAAWVENAWPVLLARDFDFGAQWRGCSRSNHLQTIMTGAARIAPDRRGVLERVGAMLKVRGRFDDSDVSEVCMLASCGLCGGRSA